MFKVKTRIRPKAPPDSPPQQPQLSKRRSVRAHGAILTAAADVAAERGYQAATIEQIAARAGTGKQTIYRWWGAKPRLYLEVYEHLVPVDGLGAASGSVAGDLKSILTALFELYRNTPAADILAGLIAQSQSDKDLAQALRDRLIDGRRAVLTTPLEQGRARGEIDAAADIEAMVDMIVAGVWYRLLVRGGALDTPFADTLVRTVTGLKEEGQHDFPV